MGKDCLFPYTDGIFVDATLPGKISAVANYNLGFKDPVCIVCENKDETVGFQM
jgi:hypothetical protein